MTRLFNTRSADKYKYLLNFQNHDMFNGALLCDTKEEVLDWCKKYDYILLGFTEAPYADSSCGFNFAMVVKDSENFQISWFHVSEFIIEAWNGKKLSIKEKMNMQD